MIVPPAISFTGDQYTATALKSRAMQFYQFVARQAEISGVPFVSRSLPLPDGSLIKISSYKEGNYSLRTGNISIFGNYSSVNPILELLVTSVDVRSSPILKFYRYGSLNIPNYLTKLNSISNIQEFEFLWGGNQIKPRSTYWVDSLSEPTQLVNWSANIIYNNNREVSNTLLRALICCIKSGNTIIIGTRMFEGKEICFLEVITPRKVVLVSINLSIIYLNVTFWGFKKDGITLYYTDVVNGDEGGIQTLKKIIFSGDYTSHTTTTLYTGNEAVTPYVEEIIETPDYSRLSSSYAKPKEYITKVVVTNNNVVVIFNNYFVSSVGESFTTSVLEDGYITRYITSSSTTNRTGKTIIKSLDSSDTFTTIKEYPILWNSVLNQTWVYYADPAKTDTHTESWSYEEVAINVLHSESIKRVGSATTTDFTIYLKRVRTGDAYTVTLNIEYNGMNTVISTSTISTVFIDGSMANTYKDGADSLLSFQMALDNRTFIFCYTFGGSPMTILIDTSKLILTHKFYNYRVDREITIPLSVTPLTLTLL
jgi:hypothetical protein